MPRTTCPKCSRRLTFAAERAGKKARCPRCKDCFVLPSVCEGDPGRAAATASANDDGRIFGMRPDQFVNALAGLAESNRRERRKNWIIRFLKVLQAIALIAILGGLVAAKTGTGGEKIVGIVVGVVALIGLVGIEMIARDMGRLR